jgi:sulfoquinovose isomerase
MNHIHEPTRLSTQWIAPIPSRPPLHVLDSEMNRLLDFAEGSSVFGGGFGYLGDDGLLQLDRPLEAWISSRMTYCFALGALAGRESCSELVDHGLTALLPGGALRDQVNGGWFSAVSIPQSTAPGRSRKEVVDDTKAAYAHAFVVLAASAAVVLGRPGARQLLDDALAIVEEHFWDEAAGLMRESFSADWAEEEPYLGANANMHSVEAFLAAADALAEHGDRWRRRAGRILERFVHHVARTAHWRMPEHFTPDGSPILDYNTDDRAHPFRPYGVTPGHLLEWARLTLHIQAGATTKEKSSWSWLIPDAQALYDTAVRDGWAPDGIEGFVYTTDFDGSPVNRARMHWVLTEAIATSAALYQVTGQQRYSDDYERYWQFAEQHFIDKDGGSWRAELDDALRPAAGTWRGKPDVYHALQATLVARLPLAPTFAKALSLVRAEPSAAAHLRANWRQT